MRPWWLNLCHVSWHSNIITKCRTMESVTRERSHLLFHLVHRNLVFLIVLTSFSETGVNVFKPNRRARTQTPGFSAIKWEKGLLKSIAKAVSLTYQTVYVDLLIHHCGWWPLQEGQDQGDGSGNESSEMSHRIITRLHSIVPPAGLLMFFIVPTERLPMSIY